jgi:ABC-type Fe3+/spermidine/putrescine transport system ATPase subunit
MSSLLVSSLSKSFGAGRILNDLSLEIESGEFFFLLGPSGCGKSTLLRIIAGLESADQGTISINGKVVNRVPPQRRGIGMVFQQYALWPHMTISQNIRYGVENLPLTNRDRDSRVKEALSLVRMEPFADRFPHQISGGQQQRVALARALAIEPSIILLDEPLSNLDAGLRQEIREELADLHRRLGTTMVYVTHDQDDALSLGSRIAVLNNGSIEQVGSPVELYSKPTSLFCARFLGEANIIPCTVSGIGPTQGSLLGDERMSVPLPSDTKAQVKVSGHLCVRPERISIGQMSDASNAASVPATIVRRSFRGARYDVTLRVGSDCHIRAFESAVPTEHLKPVGAKVVASWDPGGSIFLER